MEKLLTLKEYRKKIKLEFIHKGVKPPTPDSDKERQMYEQWVRGYKKLHGESDG